MGNERLSMLTVAGCPNPMLSYGRFLKALAASDWACNVDTGKSEKFCASKQLDGRIIICQQRFNVLLTFMLTYHRKFAVLLGGNISFICALRLTHAEMKVGCLMYVLHSA